MPIAFEDQKCAHCRFFIGDGDNIIGECRRNPPRIERRPDCDQLRNARVWPAVSTRDWCGKFKERPNAEN